MSLRRERTFILTLLLGLAAVSWAILMWQSRTAQGMSGGLTMGMGAALFLAIWVVMMVSMMLPSAALAILSVARVQRDPATRRYALASSWACAGGGLLIWGPSD